MASYSLLIYVFLFFGFLENFATCGQKLKKLEKNKENHKPITFISHEVVILFFCFLFSRGFCYFLGEISISIGLKRRIIGEILILYEFDII